MVRRTRTAKARKITLEDLTTFGITGRASLIAQFGTEEAAIAEWEAIRGQWQHTPGRRPEAWWAFEDGVPEWLRECGPYVVDMDELDAWADRRRHLADARTDWLRDQFPSEFLPKETAE